MNNRNYDLSKKERGVFGFHPLFDDFFNFPVFETKKPHHAIMKTDIFESKTNYNLVIEVPGISKENVELTLNDGYLTVKVSKNEESTKKDEENNIIIHQERFSGSYSRSFYVGKITEEEINAKMNDGLLSIVIPKQSVTKQVKKTISIE